MERSPRYPLLQEREEIQPSNYRPVSITSIVCKIMESITRDNLIKHINLNNLFSKCQHGFIKGCSCTSNNTRSLDRRNYLPTSITLASGGSSIFPLVFHQPASLAICAVTPAGSVHTSRGDNVMRMWVQLKR